MKLLLVEDSTGMRKLMVSMLRSLGYQEITEAQHGAEAWEYLREDPPDLLLTDWIMPVMDGIQLVQKVREDPGFDHMPILMFTARSAKEDVIRALQSGVDTYIAKPFSAPQLRAKIASIMGRRSHRRIHLLLANQDLRHRDADHPLLVLGEAAASARQLDVPDNREVLQFLTQCSLAVQRVNALAGELNLGYILEVSTSNVATSLRQFGERIRMVILGADLPGGGPTLARLISINRRQSMAVFVVCHVQSEIPTKERYGLQHLGITVFERSRMDTQAMEDLINEFILAPMRDGVPATLPAPEEIRQRLENDIRTMVNLPVLPRVYHEIVALDRQADSDISDWIKAVEVDPMTRAQVIRRARSPIYGFQGEINQAGKAIILLGKNVIKEIVVSGAVRRSFEGIQESGFDIQDFWLHSVAVAFTARLLSFPLEESAWTPDQRTQFQELQLEDECLEELRRRQIYTRLPLAAEQDPFVAGVMHDIGKVALIQSYPGLFPMILDALGSRDWGVPMLTAEQQVAGGADHALVGRILAETWKLGDALTEVVERHHAPGDNNFAQLIALADFLGGALYTYPRNAAFPAVRLLNEEPGTDPPAAQASGEQATEDQQSSASAGDEPSDAAASGEDPRKAVQAFLPEAVLDRLEMSMDDVLQLGRILAPTVRKHTEALRKSQ